MVVAALSACGGGSGGDAATSTSATGTTATSATATTAAATTTAVATTTAATTDTVAVASSSAASSADTTSGDQGGDASTASAADASSDTSSASALAVKASSGAVTIATQGQTFKVVGTMSVRYGAGSAWTTKSVTDSGTCTAAFFGVSSSGLDKSCQVLLSTLGSGPVLTAGLPGAEGSTFYVFGSTDVQYGANGKFVTKALSGRATCSNAFFGTDPVPNVVKSCSRPAAASTTTTPPPTTSTTTSLLPVVDKTKIPAAAVGFSTARVMAANVADPSQVPVPSDIGDFRLTCDFSHMSYDDPIVAPGGVGGHLHTFFGNTGTNGNSTAASIAGSGNSTCAGGTLNRTAYWVPAVIDTTDGTPQQPIAMMAYYKQGYNYIPSAAIHPFPAGLRIVAGSSASSGPQDNTAFNCYRSDGSITTTKSIPTDCPTGATLGIGVAFPQCWDGVNLDSPDHKSHMAYPGNGCPATHPVAVTGITLNVTYKVGANGTSKWRLSSDNYDKSLPGGYSTHADWFDGWNTDTMNTWVTRCINATMDCHAYLLGDGRILY